MSCYQWVREKHKCFLFKFFSECRVSKYLSLFRFKNILFKYVSFLYMLVLAAYRNERRWRSNGFENCKY
jgi:hypothetical protein